MLHQKEREYLFLGGKYKNYRVVLVENSSNEGTPYLGLTYVPPSKYETALQIENEIFTRYGAIKPERPNDWVNAVSNQNLLEINEGLKYMSIRRLFGLADSGLVIVTCKNNMKPVSHVINGFSRSKLFFDQIWKSSVENREIETGEDLFLIATAAFDAGVLI